MQPHWAMRVHRCVENGLRSDFAMEPLAGNKEVDEATATPASTIRRKRLSGRSEHPPALIGRQLPDFVRLCVPIAPNNPACVAELRHVIEYLSEQLPIATRRLRLANVVAIQGDDMQRPLLSELHHSMNPPVAMGTSMWDAVDTTRCSAQNGQAARCRATRIRSCRPPHAAPTSSEDAGLRCRDAWSGNSSLL